MVYGFLILIGFGFFLVVVIQSFKEKDKNYPLEVLDMLTLKIELKSILSNRRTKHCIVEFGEYHVQFTMLPKVPMAIFEGVSNEYLAKEFYLTEVQYELMKSKGFYMPNEKDQEGNSSQNFFKYQSLKRQELDEFLEELERIMIDVYQYQTNHIIRLKVNSR
jgi:hypothetical protein